MGERDGIRFQCPMCRSLLQVPAHLAGNVASCGKCQKPLRIPAPANATAPVPPPPPPAIKPPAPPVRPALPSRRAVPAGSPPPRPRSQRQGTPLALIAGLVGGLIVVVGLIGGACYLWSRPQPSLPVAKTDGPVKDEVSTDTRPKDGRGAGRIANPPPESLERRLLATINRQRENEKVPALVLHDEYSRGCLEHARYLARNLPGQPDLDPHDQDPALPGATEAGRAAAHVASVTHRDPAEALSAWLQAPAHRSMLLDPALRSVGIGTVRTDGGWIAVFDWQRGNTARTTRQPRDPIIYPTAAQRDVPLAFPGNEVPDPLPQAKIKLAGYPITATFPIGVRIPDARAWLEDETGKDVSVWFSSPTRPANPKFARNQQNTVCLFAREVLRPGTRYIVRIEASVGSQEWSRTWTFTTLSPLVHKRIIFEQARDRLNYFRKAAGLDPLALDETRCRACGKHAAYLARHLDRVPNLRLNDETPDLEGYSEEGKSIAARAIPRFGGGVGAIDAIDWMLASVLNRHMVLNPSIRSMGMGAALHAPRGWVWVVSLPTTRRAGDGPTAILFPGKDQKDVPIHFGREITSMLPQLPQNTVAGYGITANFFPLETVRNVKASLTDAEGAEVDCWLSTPEKPLPNTGSYRQIILIPKKALRPATTYTVSMSALVDGSPWQETWKFTTQDLTRYRAAVSMALLKQVNELRKLAGATAVSLDEGLSKGCQLHADYVARNLNDTSVAGLGVHDENPRLPGYTKEGERAGQASVIAVISDPFDSVEGWMATLYHRIPLLDPQLKRIGYGQTLHPFRGWVTVLDSGNGK